MDALPTPELRRLFTSRFTCDVQIHSRLIEGNITGDVASEEALSQLMLDLRNQKHFRFTVQGREVVIRLMSVHTSQTADKRPFQVTAYFKGFDQTGLAEIFRKNI